MMKLNIVAIFVLALSSTVFAREAVLDYYVEGKHYELYLIEDCELYQVYEIEEDGGPFGYILKGAFDYAKGLVIDKIVEKTGIKPYVDKAVDLIWDGLVSLKDSAVSFVYSSLGWDEPDQSGIKIEKRESGETIAETTVLSTSKESVESSAEALHILAEQGKIEAVKGNNMNVVIDELEISKQDLICYLKRMGKLSAKQGEWIQRYDDGTTNCFNGMCCKAFDDYCSYNTACQEVLEEEEENKRKALDLKEKELSLQKEYIELKNKEIEIKEREVELKNKEIEMREKEIELKNEEATIKKKELEAKEKELAYKEKASKENQRKSNSPSYNNYRRKKRRKKNNHAFQRMVKDMGYGLSKIFTEIDVIGLRVEGGVCGKILSVQESGTNFMDWQGGIGVMARYNFSELLNLQWELLYTGRGHKIEETSSIFNNGINSYRIKEKQVQIQYLTLPIMLNVYAGNGVNIGIGVYGGYAINGTVKITTDQNTIRQFNAYSLIDFPALDNGSRAFSRWDAGIAAGATWGKKHWDFGVRLYRGVSNITNKKYRVQGNPWREHLLNHWGFSFCATLKIPTNSDW